MIRESDHVMPVFVGGIISGMMIFGFVLLLVKSSQISSWVDQYQSLSAGVLGVFAASVTAGILLWQIRQNYNLHRDSRNRHLYAAKSTLPLALADVSEYASKCFAVSVNMARGINVPLVLPEIPNSHLEVFKECIEQADEVHRRKLSNVLSVYQVQRSRMTSALQDYRPTTNQTNGLGHFHGSEQADKKALISGHLQSSAELKLLSDELWAFARSNDDDLEPRPYRERVMNLFMFTVRSYPEDWSRTIEFLTRVMERRKNDYSLRVRTHNQYAMSAAI